MRFFSEQKHFRIKTPIIPTVTKSSNRLSQKSAALYGLNGPKTAQQSWLSRQRRKLLSGLSPLISQRGALREHASILVSLPPAKPFSLALTEIQRTKE